MGRTDRVVVTAILVLGSWLAGIPAANAYIDPGSTTFLFQALVAGVAAGGVTVRLFWHRIIAVLRRGDDHEPPDADPR